MSKIRSVNTRPELALRKEFWRLGFRYRLNVNKLKGKPDIVFNKYKVAVFVDGEFWHGYNWSKKKPRIKANRKYWIEKIERNIERDLENTNHLQSNGWVVFRFWEHEIKENLIECVNEVIFELKRASK